MLRNIQGNLLESDCDVIAHVVNCQGVMGSGIAKQIKTKWPEAFNGYSTFLKKVGSKDAFGLCMVVVNDEPNVPVVANLFAQFNYGTNKRQLDYERLYTSLEHLVKIMKNHKWKSVGFPYGMGAGLAGGDWRIINVMIEALFDDFDINIYHYNQ
jgi:O-acetyl-ADP-ribose deacetylase (regulator of RNase III)